MDLLELRHRTAEGTWIEGMRLADLTRPAVRDTDWYVGRHPDRAHVTATPDGLRCTCGGASSAADRVCAHLVAVVTYRAQGLGEALEERRTLQGALSAAGLVLEAPAWPHAELPVPWGRRLRGRRAAEVLAALASHDVVIRLEGSPRAPGGVLRDGWSLRAVEGGFALEPRLPEGRAIGGFILRDASLHVHRPTDDPPLHIPTDEAWTFAVERLSAYDDGTLQRPAGFPAHVEANVEIDLALAPAGAQRTSVRPTLVYRAGRTVIATVCHGACIGFDRRAPRRDLAAETTLTGLLLAHGMPPDVRTELPTSTLRTALRAFPRATQARAESQLRRPARLLPPVTTATLEAYGDSVRRSPPHPVDSEALARAHRSVLADVTARVRTAATPLENDPRADATHALVRGWVHAARRQSYEAALGALTQLLRATARSATPADDTHRILPDDVAHARMERWLRRSARHPLVPFSTCANLPRSRAALRRRLDWTRRDLEKAAHVHDGVELRATGPAPIDGARVVPDVETLEGPRRPASERGGTGDATLVGTATLQVAMQLAPCFLGGRPVGLLTLAALHHLVVRPPREGSPAARAGAPEPTGSPLGWGTPAADLEDDATWATAEELAGEDLRPFREAAARQVRDALAAATPARRDAWRRACALERAEATAALAPLDGKGAAARAQAIEQAWDTVLGSEEGIKTTRKQARALLDDRGIPALLRATLHAPVASPPLSGPVARSALVALLAFSSAWHHRHAYAAGQTVATWEQTMRALRAALARDAARNGDLHRGAVVAAMAARRPDVPRDHALLAHAVRRRWIAEGGPRPPTVRTVDPVEALLALDEASALAAWAGAHGPHPADVAAVVYAIRSANAAERARRVLTLVHARFPPRDDEVTRGLAVMLDDPAAGNPRDLPVLLHAPIVFDASHHALAAGAPTRGEPRPLAPTGPLSRVTLSTAPHPRLVCEGEGWSIAGLPPDVLRAGTPFVAYTWALPPRTCVLRRDGAIVAVLKPRDAHAIRGPVRSSQPTTE